MRYDYAYKTSDGIRHEASIDAESREAVFVALRERGIKAIKVVAADGSKASGFSSTLRGRARRSATTWLRPSTGPLSTILPPRFASRCA